ncbi:glycosyltransferase family 4 protein [Tulasnella calospora MUT 4182]|uniref:GDP-Man:Man(3)GlcNAc(2)-PP-Dol alpha-1,2-mannosyltransferase n=1 Tax=Tulasnella calospora MUT 4182 TaxID=1051891 RepID=A0A0C3L610_9AGAM|nr:glycosyltransferase family 4 protein [Tulasnella calospora MUT 4182]
MNSMGTHPFYPHLIVLGFTLGAAAFRWRAWRRRVHDKRKALIQRHAEAVDEKSATANKRIVGFFHPYCNAGGGGEVVLWTAVAYLQRTEPDVICAIYTGDKDATKDQILAKAKARFDIDVSPHNLEFIWLNNRKQVDAATWPRFTLIGQSIGSVVLALEAVDALVPDIYIDTMGYAFTFNLIAGLSRIFTRIPAGAYIHYPTISTDMLERVKSRKAGHTNEDAVAKSRWKSTAKLVYYHIFALLYSFSLFQADAVIVNSSWTGAHIDSLVALALSVASKVINLGILEQEGVPVVYPPCDTSKLKDFPLEGREKVVLSVAQFRPEKEHATQVQALHLFLEEHPQFQSGPDKLRLVLIGGCRTVEDEARVEKVRELVQELHLEDNVEFVVNAPYDVLLDWLSRASVGISTMVDEHFGINVVEYMAAGLIPLVHASGGPLKDIVTPFTPPDSSSIEPGLTGFHATTTETYASMLDNIFVQLPDSELLAIRGRARLSAERFSRAQFEEGWAAFWKRLSWLPQDHSPRRRRC